MQWELQVLEEINNQLQFKLKISNNEVLQLTEANKNLEREKKITEEELLPIKLELKSIKEGKSSPSDMKRHLEQMKHAFLKSEEVIKAKNAELAEQTLLVLFTRILLL
jgi:hypothetical protein